MHRHLLSSIGADRAHARSAVASGRDPARDGLGDDVAVSVKRASGTVSVGRVSGYCSRWGFVLERCTNRKVLHLGCIGETSGSPEAKAEAFATNRVLHTRLSEVAAEVVGVDIDAPAVELIRSRHGAADLLIGDVERLDALALEQGFDIILCGDLLEHLSCPGRALDGIKRFMLPTTQLLVSMPNVFGLLANVRFSLGRYRDGAQHVATYSKFQLATLLERHGFKMTELYTCYDHPPRSWLQRAQYLVGVPLFTLLPERGGTLLAVAKMAA